MFNLYALIQKMQKINIQVLVVNTPISPLIFKIGFKFCRATRAPGLTSGLQGSMNVHRGALLLVPQ